MIWYHGSIYEFDAFSASHILPSSLTGGGIYLTSHEQNAMQYATHDTWVNNDSLREKARMIVANAKGVEPNSAEPNLIEEVYNCLKTDEHWLYEVSINPQRTLIVSERGLHTEGKKLSSSDLTQALSHSHNPSDAERKARLYGLITARKSEIDKLSTSDLYTRHRLIGRKEGPELTEFQAKWVQRNIFPVVREVAISVNAEAIIYKPSVSPTFGMFRDADNITHAQILNAKKVKIHKKTQLDKSQIQQLSMAPEFQKQQALAKAAKPPAHKPSI